MLIVCEGTRTEKDYFEAFPVTSAVVSVVGTGTNTRTVVEHARVIAARAAARDEPFEQVWCVFDRDSFPKVRVNAAVQECEAAGFSAAWSNEAFELWFLLHFEYCQHAHSRADYVPKLSAHLGTPYRKSDPDLYVRLLPRVATALANAKKLRGLHIGKSPADANPMTRVDHLVAELLKHARK